MFCSTSFECATSARKATQGHTRPHKATQGYTRLTVGAESGERGGNKESIFFRKKPGLNALGDFAESEQMTVRRRRERASEQIFPADLF